MKTDAELLRQFVADRSEAAFTTLVDRHLTMVRATALRRVGGDRHAADDIAQQVFVTLARKASALRGHATLAGWLYVATHHASAAWVRREQRRQRREATAHSMEITDSAAGPPDEANRLRPLLDDALITLKPAEREAIVMRFFAGHSFAEIGATLQLSEEAARKRVHRALDRLQAVLVRRGVTSTVSVLGSTLAAAGLETAPTALAVKVVGAALAQSATGGATAVFVAMLWPAATIAVVVGGILAIGPQHRANRTQATALAHQTSETQTAIAALEVENDQLARELRLLASGSVAQKHQAPLGDPLPPPPPAAPTAASKSVVVTRKGTLNWEGEPVTLDTFMQNLASYQAAAPGGESRLIVHADGTDFAQLNFVLDEARKIGITNLVIESDTQPEGASNTWF